MLDDSFPLAFARRPLTRGCRIHRAWGGHEGTLPFSARAVWFDDDGAAAWLVGARRAARVRAADGAVLRIDDFPAFHRRATDVVAAPGPVVTRWDPGSRDWGDSFDSHRNVAHPRHRARGVLLVCSPSGERARLAVPRLGRGPRGRFGGLRDIHIAPRGDGALALHGGDLVRFDAAGAVTLRLRVSTDPALPWTRLRASRDQSLAAVARGGTLTVYRVADGSVVSTMEGLQWPEGGPRMGFAGGDRRLIVTERRGAVESFYGCKGSTSDTVLCVDVATGRRLWSTELREPIAAQLDPIEPEVMLAPGDGVVVLPSPLGAISVRLDDGSVVRALEDAPAPPHVGSALHVAWTPDLGTMAVASGHCFALVDTATREARPEPLLWRGGARLVASRHEIGAIDGAGRLHRLTPSARVLTPPADLVPWALSPDGSTLLCLGRTAFDFQHHRASIVDTATGELRADDVLPWINPRRVSLDPTGEWAWIEGARGDLGAEREAALVRYPFTGSPHTVLPPLALPCGAVLADFAGGVARLQIDDRERRERTLLHVDPTDGSVTLRASFRLIQMGGLLLQEEGGDLSVRAVIEASPSCDDEPLDGRIGGHGRLWARITGSRVDVVDRAAAAVVATIDLQPTADRARAAVVSRDERFVVIATARGLLLCVALAETGDVSDRGSRPPPPGSPRDVYCAATQTAPASEKSDVQRSSAVALQPLPRPSPAPGYQHSSPSIVQGWFESA